MHKPVPNLSTSRRWSRSLWIISGLACITALFGLSGCFGQPAGSSSNVTTVTQSESVGDGATAGGGGTAELAQTIYEMFNLQRLDLETDAQIGVQDLNRLLSDSSTKPALPEPIPAGI